MQHVVSVAAMRESAARLRAGRQGLSLVPTMGALHAGHEALIAAAVSAGQPVVVSIFVNPLAFGLNENMGTYPRSLEADLELCEHLGVDAVFAPSVEEIYPKGYSTYVAEETVSKHLCGASRPTHFRGVTTLFAKLINIIGPDRIYLGQKDPQHVAVLRKMAVDLNYDVDFMVVPMVREHDGLPEGVRNRELTNALRAEALAISGALKVARQMVESGVRNTDRLIAEATHLIRQHHRLRIIYVSLVDSTTMEAVREVVPGRTLMCIAAWVDEVRLTDNTEL